MFAKFAVSNEFASQNEVAVFGTNANYRVDMESFETQTSPAANAGVRLVAASLATLEAKRSCGPVGIASSF